MIGNRSGNRLTLSIAMAIMSFALFHGVTGNCMKSDLSLTYGAPAMNAPATTLDGSTITITCKPAFTGGGLTGTLTCTSGSWSTATAACTAVDCMNVNFPTIADSATISLDAAGQVGFRDTATVTCSPGYYTTNPKLACIAENKWNSTTCLAVSCLPPSITSGTFTLMTQGNMGYQDKATVACDTGYTPASTEVTCGGDNMWTNLPTCTPPAGSCMKSALSGLTYGAPAMNAPAITLNSKTITITCKSASTGGGLTGTLTCTSGLWSTTPACTTVSCNAQLPLIANGTATLAVQGMMAFGDTATITCNAGYTPSPQTLTCGTLNQWSNATCIVDCGMPTVANSLSMVISNTTVNSIGMGVCAEGFTTDDGRNFTLTCAQSGNWTGSTCQVVDCGSLTVADSLSVNVTAGTTYNENATITCLPGFVPLGQTSNSTSRCQQSGAWETFTCSGAAAFLPGQLCSMLAAFVLLSVKFY